jgi:hypothetical protein
MTLTVSRDISNEQNRVLDEQDTLCPHRQRTDLEENRVSSLQ